MCLKGSWSDFDPQAYNLYGEDQNHETSFKGKALQAAVDSWCKIQVLTKTLDGWDDKNPFKSRKFKAYGPRGRMTHESSQKDSHRHIFGATLCRLTELNFALIKRNVLVSS